VIAGGIALIVLGAIAAFALNIPLTWLDVQLLGYIMLGAGIVVLALGIVFGLRRRTTTLSTRTGTDPVSGEQFMTRTESENPLP
jgi:hypothetical protein